MLPVTADRRSGSDVARTYLLLGMAACRERSLERMRRYVDPGLAYCEERDLAVWGRYLLAIRGWLELEEGAWDRAAETVSIVLTQRCPLASLQAQIVLGLLRARRGDPDPWTPLHEADRTAQATGQLWWIAQVAAARAEAAWLAGRAEGVADATDDAFRRACSLESPWPAGELACWRRRVGIEEDAPPCAAEPFALQLSGDWTGAAHRWSEGGCRYESALALADAGTDDSLRDALAELQRLDARPAATLVSRRRRERGARGLPRGPRPTTRENAAQLPRRELDVLALLADGLRNRDIAARLHLSHRTVETPRRIDPAQARHPQPRTSRPRSDAARRGRVDRLSEWPRPRAQRRR